MSGSGNKSSSASAGGMSLAAKLATAGAAGVAVAAAAYFFLRRPKQQAVASTEDRKRERMLRRQQSRGELDETKVESKKQVESGSTGTQKIKLSEPIAVQQQQQKAVEKLHDDQEQQQRQRQQEQQQQAQQKKKQEERRPSTLASAESDFVPTDTLPSDEQLRQVLLAAITQFQVNPDVNPTSRENQQIFHWAMMLTPGDYPHACVYAAQFVIIYTTIAEQTSELEEDEAQRRYLQAFNLARAGTSSDAQPQLQPTSRLLALDAAQRLKDAELISDVYSEISKGGVSNLSVEEAVMCLTSAPVLGHWKDTAEIGDLIEQQASEQRLMEQLHGAAISNGTADYTVLIDLARTILNDKPTPEPSSLEFADFNLTELKFCKMSTDDPKTLVGGVYPEQLSDPSTHDAFIQLMYLHDGIATDHEWQDVPLGTLPSVKVTGAMAFCHGFTTMSIPMTGTWEQDTMLLRGNVALSTSQDAGNQQQIMKHTETYLLKKLKEEGWYQGVYVLHRAMMSPTAAASEPDQSTYVRMWMKAKLERIPKGTASALTEEGDVDDLDLD